MKEKSLIPANEKDLIFNEARTSTITMKIFIEN